MRVQRVDLAYWPTRTAVAEVTMRRRSQWWRERLCQGSESLEAVNINIPTYLLCIVFSYNSVLSTSVSHENDMTFCVSDHQISSHL